MIFTAGSQRELKALITTWLIELARKKYQAAIKAEHEDWAKLHDQGDTLLAAGQALSQATLEVKE